MLNSTWPHCILSCAEPLNICQYTGTVLLPIERIDFLIVSREPIQAKSLNLVCVLTSVMDSNFFFFFFFFFFLRECRQRLNLLRLSSRGR